MRLASARVIVPALTLVIIAVTAGVVVLPTAAVEPSAGPRPALGITLTAEERAVWRPLPVARNGIPVLLYHGIGEASEFGNPADSAYGVGRADFAKQMALLHAGGYETITLEQFRRFQAGGDVDLPPRPLLLTFDDALASSFEGADAILRELGWTAVMFVDVGAVHRGATGYAGWEHLRTAQRSGRWELQLHAGRGHHNIAYDARGTAGPYYAYRIAGRERLDDWWRRVRRDLEWGEARLQAEIPDYRRQSFAPPYGNFGQLATNDPRIPERLGSWLRGRYGLVFVQEPARYARVGDAFAPRLQITRRMTGGEIHAWLDRERPL
jgi:peptidoglycan/xylan/chitin deacetylase (PgdA/CDA1 family)